MWPLRTLSGFIFSNQRYYLIKSLKIYSFWDFSFGPTDRHGPCEIAISRKIRKQQSNLTKNKTDLTKYHEKQVFSFWLSNLISLKMNLISLKMAFFLRIQHLSLRIKGANQWNTGHFLQFTADMCEMRPIDLTKSHEISLKMGDFKAVTVQLIGQTSHFV